MDVSKARKGNEKHSIYRSSQFLKMLENAEFYKISRKYFQKIKRILKIILLEEALYESSVRKLG